MVDQCVPGEVKERGERVLLVLLSCSFTTTYPCRVNANQLLNIFSATDSVLLNSSLGYDSATVRLTRSDNNLLSILIIIIKVLYFIVSIITLWHSLVCYEELS